MKPDSADLVMIGTLYRAHGVRGEVKMYPETDDIKRLKDVRQVWVGRSLQNLIPLTLESARVQNKSGDFFFLLKFAEFKQREEIDLIKGRDVYVLESDLPPIEEGEFYVHDLMGFNVITEDGENVGSVVDWFEMPAHPVFVVQTLDGEERMIPDVPEFILDILPDEKAVRVHLIEGIL